MKLLPRLALGLVLCLLLASCVVDSENPLGSPESAQIDRRLLGDWIATNGDIVHFSAKDTHWMQIVTTPKASDSSSKKPEPDLFYVTLIGDDTYFNFRTVSKDGKGGSTTRYSFNRYTIEPDQTLHVWGMSQDEMAAAVRAGKLKGTVQARGTTGKPPHTDIDVHLTDSGKNIVKFIRHHDPTEIFSDEREPLTRIRTSGD